MINNHNMILTQPPEKLAMAVVTNAFMQRCHLAVMTRTVVDLSWTNGQS